MNVERAIDWAFSHMDEPDSDQEADGDTQMNLVDLDKVYECEKPGMYNL